MNWDQIEVIFGGSFDPPHLGHVQAIQGLRDALGIQKISILPSKIPPLKKTETSASQRLEMARICFEKIEGVEIQILTLELDRPGDSPSYTFDTLKDLGAPEREIAFCLGWDQIPHWEKWSHFPEILKFCHWIVLKRKGVDSTEVLEKMAEWERKGFMRKLNSTSWETLGKKQILWLETPAISVSSTQIREQIQASGVIPEEFLTPKLKDYLKEQRLYGTPS